jgi:hypothetical protein
MSYNPPIINTEYIFYISLEDNAIPGTFKANPTVADGDFKISLDGGAFENVNAYSVTPAGGRAVKITLSTTQMNGSNVVMIASDQTSPKEWADFSICIQPAAGDVYPLVSTELADLITTVGVAGAGLTSANIGKAALEAINLDHLIKEAKDTSWAATVTKESVIDLMTSKAAAQEYDRTTDSLEAILNSALPDSYAAHEAQPTMSQAVLEILQFLTEKAVSSTTVSVKKPDGSTAVMEFTLDSATAPTSITRKANP